ncbi:MAG: zinc-ribbon domain-containing protein [Deltaproteobacteria bacterium]|nr:zinc-ribbon domain-containing protein [Deltaproteobacteria bacterium]
MPVKITCPNCRYSKTVPQEKLPPGVCWATCPRCRHRFKLERPGSEPLAQGPVKTTGTLPGKGPREEKGDDLGYWKGLYDLSRGVLFSPGLLFQEMSARGSLKDSLGFGLLFGSVGAMFGIFWQFLVIWGKILPYTEDLPGQEILGLLFIGALITVPLWVTIGMFLASGVLHACLWIVGGGSKGFEGTFRVIALSQAAGICQVIPFFGGAVGGIWRLAVRIVGLKKIHRTTYPRVILAFLIPPAAVALGILAIAAPLLLSN